MSNVSTKNPFDLLFIEEVSEVSPPVVIQLNKTQQQKPKQTIKTKPLEPSVVPERDVKDTRGTN